eukprot:UN04598
MMEDEGIDVFASEEDGGDKTSIILSDLSSNNPQQNLLKIATTKKKEKKRRCGWYIFNKNIFDFNTLSSEKSMAFFYSISNK